MLRLPGMCRGWQASQVGLGTGAAVCVGLACWGVPVPPGPGRAFCVEHLRVGRSEGQHHFFQGPGLPKCCRCLAASTEIWDPFR